MPDKFISRVYLGSGTIAQTRDACYVDQQNKDASLKSIEPATLKRDGSQDTKVNVAKYKKESIVDIPGILTDLKLIDVSTPAGASEAAATFGTHTHLFRCNIFVGNELKDVEVFARRD